MLSYTTLMYKSESYNKHIDEDFINLLDKTFYIPDDFDFDIVEITKEFIARPDLLSLKAYGDDMYADIICKLNGISNPFELNVGMKVLLPTREYIDGFAYKPTNSELMEDQDGQDYMPKPKLKNQKRKANEAVIGDTRFKVDPKKRVIIY